MFLIFLQFIAPFIHAHAYGIDDIKAHIFHLHTIEISNVDNVNSTLTQAHVGENEIIGAITTVASGIKTTVADDIADGIAVMSLLFTLALLVFSVSARFVWQLIQVLPTHRYFYALQNPRAPPC